MFNIIVKIINGLCCITTAAAQAQSAVNSSLCCLPVKCVLEIKDCYDHCNSDVTPTNDVQMAGAPSAEIMA